MKHKTPVIRQHASNLGNVKGLPKGSGQGGYFIDDTNMPTNVDRLRELFSLGHAVHIQDGDKADYILNGFMGGDTVQGSHICKIKLSDAIKKGVTDDINDIISGTDTINVNDVVLKNVFSDDEDALNFFLMDTEQVKYEAATRFDQALNEIYIQIIS